jgi:hypothetical protein
MIYALNICGNRDRELSELMESTLRKYCLDIEEFERRNFDALGWGNGSGWDPSIMKVNAIKSILRFGLRDDDFILCVDSDVVFCTPEVFTFVKPEYGIIGIKNSTDFPALIGPLKHMSGCLIFLRADIAKQIANLSNDQLNEVRRQFKSVALTENEDILVSYLAQMLGAEHCALPGYLNEGDFETDLKSGELRSFYHLNYHPDTFLGVPVDGKEEFAKVLAGLGYKL